jgi:competence protein ComEA
LQHRSRAEIFGISIFVLLAVVWLGSISLELIHKTSTANSKTRAEIEEQKQPTEICVHVEGAVQNPGLIKVPAGSRIVDAIRVAGGALNDADTTLLNLAENLQDGQKIYIPKKGEVLKTPLVTSSTDPGTIEPTGKIIKFPVNLNTASKEELMQLPGIGEKRAQDIIDYRTRRGSFKKKTDLMNVYGIGEGIYDKIKDLVYI